VAPSASPSARGSIDVYSRIIAEHMSATLGRPVIIEIKAGANGNIAAQWVAEGPADGSQVWVAAQSMIEINPSSYRNLRWKRSDFIPVIKGIETPLVLVAHPSVPATTFDQWGDWARANRGKLSYANYGPGTISHFSATSSTSASALATRRCLTAATPRR
jgi:tripartite-type tricarboxylate transporter receptor subunit TctC